MNKLIMILALLVSTSSMAVGLGNDNPPSTGGDTTVTVTPIIDANARARAEAYAASLSQAKATSTSSATNAAQSVAGGSTSSITTGDTTVNTNYPEKQRIYGVPSVNVPVVYPTSPCMGSSSIGGSGVGFGFGIGTSWTDDECGIRETARSFNGLGLHGDAVSVLCTSKYAVVAPICNKQTKE